MLMRPTRVAAVICHALSPELSHDAYGFTASFLHGASPEGLPERSGRRPGAPHSRRAPGTASGPSQLRDPGCPGVAQTGRPHRCPSGTPLVSHGRVSDTFPVCYAVRAVLLPVYLRISTMFRTVRN